MRGHVYYKVFSDRVAVYLGLARLGCPSGYLL